VLGVFGGGGWFYGLDARHISAAGRLVARFFQAFRRIIE